MAALGRSSPKMNAYVFTTTLPDSPVSVLDSIPRPEVCIMVTGINHLPKASLPPFFFTLVTGPRRSLILKLSDTRVYEP